MSDTSRRDFIRRTAHAGVLATMPGPSPLGANERIRFAAIGLGGRGRFVMEQFGICGNVEFPIVCDPNILNSRKANQDLLGGKAEMVDDYRKVLDRKDIDGVLIATPDHWHAIAAIHACQAGKDVYVEKPLGHNVVEGRRVVQAARRYGRVVQVGIQQQSGAHYIEAANFVRSGKLGKITLVRMWNHVNRWPGAGVKPDEPCPETLNWDLWLGPAQMTPFNAVRASSSFRSFWDYAGGTMTDWGAHHVGSVHHVMGQDRPTSVVATGGKLVIQDMYETPDTMSVLWEYPGGWTLLYTLLQTNTYNPEGSNYGIVFHGVNGTLFLDRRGFEVFPEGERAQAQAVGRPRVDNFNPTDLNPPHIRNFLECMRSRETPVANPEVGHRATLVAHLGNIAVRTGRKLTWDSEHETIPGDSEACALLTREYRKPYLLPSV